MKPGHSPAVGGHNAGFTVLEIIAVLVVIGVLTAVVVSKVGGSTNDMQQSAELTQIKSHLRFTQGRAMADQSCRYYLTFNAGTYNLSRLNLTDGTTQALVLPGQENNPVNLLSGLSVYALQTIGFDSLGTPMTGEPEAMVPFSGTLIFDGGKNRSITFTEAGFIR